MVSYRAPPSPALVLSLFAAALDSVAGLACGVRSRRAVGAVVQQRLVSGHGGVLVVAVRAGEAELDGVGSAGRRETPQRRRGGIDAREVHPVALDDGGTAG